MRILLVEHDPSVAASFSERLAQEHFVVELTGSGAEAQRLASKQPFDFVILDWNLRGANGSEVLRTIRSQRPELPVMVVADSARVEERVRALDAGADDCLAKPLAFAEVAARIRAILRRRNPPERAVLIVDDLVLDRLNRTVARGPDAIELSPREFALLECLMRHADQPVRRSEIVRDVWKLKSGAMTNVVDVYVNYLRKKIEGREKQPLIRTVRGVGYQISGNATAQGRLLA